MKKQYTFTKALLGALFLCLIPAIAFAVSLGGYPKFQALDSNGDPLSGGKLYTYQPGSTTNKAAYQDRDGSTAHTNPIILDSRGEATIYFDGSYKLVLKDSDDTLIWTLDNFQGEGVDYASGTSGYIALWGASGTSTLMAVPTLSGVSIADGTITSAKISEPLDMEIASTTADNTITGRTYVCNLTSPTTLLSGKTVYGGWIGNYGSTSEVTGTLPQAEKGMSVAFILNQGQVSGSTIVVAFNAVDTVYGLTGGFSTGDSVVCLSAVTLEPSLVAVSWADNSWWITSVTGESYRNQ